MPNSNPSTTVISKNRAGIVMPLTLEKQEDWFELALKAAPTMEFAAPAKRAATWVSGEAIDDDDDDDVDDLEPDDDDEDADIVLPPTTPEDDPFDDFDDEDFDDDFDDDFEEELDDDYEIEPDDSEMFPAEDDDEELELDPLDDV
jgi:hypothetical protein